MKLPSLHEASSLRIAYTDPAIHTTLTSHLGRTMSRLYNRRQIAVVCIGTDRSTGDALGPLIGTALHKYACPLFELYGTLESPVHAMNLEETMAQIDREMDNPFIVGIDACLGQVSSVGSIQIGLGPVRPGAGVNKELPPVGDMHITGIVNVGGFMEYFVLQNTRLHLVMSMSDIISTSLLHAILSLERTVMPAVTLE
ncbi:spore protease YyaC [Paenibacillus sp. IB182496]|uniref:Spore protease YyaC n=1 Tax=Paenibacillus sabuli TaxID=2772509 RepID=A0A927GU56_9BACL|nr:spore protease YyaC [Paenibacillus sabuli]MBD2848011.1 spore protease YyaC [Paenibacillus sabuli]